MTIFWFCIIAVGAIGLSIAPARQLIETSMVWHMAVQMPLLITAGWLGAASYTGGARGNWLKTLNQEGLTGMLAASLILAYWMLPVAIDSALVHYPQDLRKIASLLLCGAILRDFFDRAHWVTQLFFLGYTLSMLVWLGVYFMSTDLRLCNAYSLESQVQAGKSLLTLTALTGVSWAIYAVQKPVLRV